MKLIIDTSDCKKVTREEDLSVKEWIELGIKPTVELEQVLRVEKTDKYFITQAACSDGKYIYINFKPRNDNEIKILKYDMNYNLVSESEDLPLGHANGMTYNTKTDEIVVCDCNDKTIFYTVDAKTLTYKNKIQVTEGGGGGGITYSATRDLYAVNNGGSLVNIYDTDFNLVRSFNRTNKNYTNQDCGSDEELIFFELSKAGTDNLIDIYVLRQKGKRFNQKWDSFCYDNAYYEHAKLKNKDDNIIFTIRHLKPNVKFFSIKGKNPTNANMIKIVDNKPLPFFNYNLYNIFDSGYANSLQFCKLFKNICQKKSLRVKFKMVKVNNERGLATNLYSLLTFNKLPVPVVFNSSLELFVNTNLILGKLRAILLTYSTILASSVFKLLKYFNLTGVL